MVLSPTDRRIYDYVRHSSGSDRVELARELALPRPTVVSAVRRLLSSGDLIAVDAEQGRPVRGRGRHLVRVPGPSVAVGVVSWSRGRVNAALYSGDRSQLFETTLDRPDPTAGPDGLAAAVEALIGAAGEVADHALGTVVISAPATFLWGIGASTEHASISDVREGVQITVPSDLDQYLAGKYNVAFITENNANLAALGEQLARSRRIDNFIYLKLGYNGIGSALVINGALARGAHGYAGELGHLQLDRNGRLCRCGGRGCLWTQVQELTLADVSRTPDGPLDLAGLTRLSHNGDPGANRMLADIGRVIGRALGHIGTFLDPELIIVDSTIGPPVDHIITGLHESFSVDAPPVIARNVRIEKSTLGSDAEIRGALEIPREAARRG